MTENQPEIAPETAPDTTEETPQEVVDADHVTVLVMLNRMVSTKENPEAASSASRLSVAMERQDGTWKLAELEAL